MRFLVKVNIPVEAGNGDSYVMRSLSADGFSWTDPVVALSGNCFISEEFLIASFCKSSGAFSRFVILKVDSNLLEDTAPVEE